MGVTCDSAKGKLPGNFQSSENHAYTAVQYMPAWTFIHLKFYGLLTFALRNPKSKCETNFYSPNAQ